MARKAGAPPWKRKNPRAGKAAKHLSSAEKKAAKARAKRAGRRYPNLVDNMRVASKKTSKKKPARKSAGKTARKSSTKKSGKKKTTAKRARKTGRSGKRATKSERAHANREKDPRGGLTAAGRRAFARREGAHLKPGVRKKVSKMTASEMRRKGSWAVRFYGRAKLPPLIDSNGRPTRHALSAHAWGEPVPRTVAAARRIAAKGERLLKRYRALKERKR